MYRYGSVYLGSAHGARNVTFEQHSNGLPQCYVSTVPILFDFVYFNDSFQMFFFFSYFRNVYFVIYLITYFEIVR